NEAPPQASAPSDPSPTRGQRRARNAVLACVALAYFAMLLWRIGLRPDLETVLFQLFIWAVVLVFSLLVVVRPGARGLPSNLRQVQAALVVIALVFAIAVLLTTSFAAPLEWRSTGVCLALASAMALGPLLLAGMALRRSFLSAPAWRGAAVGAACGLA